MSMGTEGSSRKRFRSESPSEDERITDPLIEAQMMIALAERVKSVEHYHQITVRLLAYRITGLEKENHKLAEKLQDCQYSLRAGLRALADRLEKRMDTLFREATIASQQDPGDGAHAFCWIDLVIDYSLLPSPEEYIDTQGLSLSQVDPEEWEAKLGFVETNKTWSQEGGDGSTTESD